MELKGAAFFYIVLRDFKKTEGKKHFYLGLSVTCFRFRSPIQIVSSRFQVFTDPLSQRGTRMNMRST